MSEFTDELKKLDLAINLPSKTYFAIEEKFKDWQSPKQLVEVPQYIDEAIRCLSNGSRDSYDAIYIIKCKVEQHGDTDLLDVYDWIFEKGNSTVFERAWLDGYTVEKEQLYEVVFYVDEEDDRFLLMKTGKTNLFEFENQNEGYYKQQFTESEIKAIDERYWTFAVPVDEV